MSKKSLLLSSNYNAKWEYLIDGKPEWVYSIEIKNNGTHEASLNINVVENTSTLIFWIILYNKL